MNFDSKKISRILMLTGIMIFALSFSVFAAVDSGDIAAIGEEGYATLEEAIDAIETTGTIQMIDDVEFETTVIIPKGKNITLDLNGKVISGVDTQTNKNFELISNKGTLTIEDSVGTGKITVSATTDRAYGNYSTPIANQQGNLIINGGTIEHTGGTTMAYAIDSLTNGGIGDAILTINGGRLVSTYIGIRQFANSDSCENKLTINSGDISSSTGLGSVFLQSPSTKKNIGTLNINAGKISTIFVYGEVGGDTTALRVNIAENVEAEVDYDCIEARIGEVYYETLAKAFAAAESGNEIILVNDVNVADSFIDLSEGNEYTLNLNGHTISSTLDPIFKLKSGKLNLIDTAEEKGKISGTKGIIWVFGDAANNRELVIDKGVVLETVNSMCVYVCNKNSILRTAGNLLSVNDATIKGFGSTGYGDIEVYITGGNVISENGLGIYFPNTSLLEITGGYIKGPTAIYQKAGTLNISGNAVIEADGEKSDYEYNGSGANITGEAVVVDFCNYPGGKPAINVTGGYFKSANNRDIGSYATTEGEEVVGFISGGYFTTNPSEYLIEGKAAIKSDNPDYNFMVGEKDAAIEFDTTTKVGEPETELNVGEITEADFTESFEADADVLESIASPIANDSTKIETSGDVLVAAIEAVTGTPVNSGDVIIIVQPYIDVTLTSGDKNDKYLSFEIKAKYNVVATAESGDFEIGVDAAIVGSGDLEVEESIDMILALPEGFATSGDTLYVHHIKEDGTKYIYTAKVSDDGKSLSFTNPHGFSTFEVKGESGAAQNETTKTIYETLADAIADVKNGEIITLLANNEETVSVNKVIAFGIEKGAFAFSGDVTAGSNVVRTKEADGTVIEYTFAKKVTPTKPSTGGGSSETTYRIVVTQTEGGKINPSSVNVTEGKDKTFTIKANEGYEIKDVIVDAKSVGKVTEYTFENVTERHAITAIFVREETVEEWVNPFKDVEENDWYFEAVKYVNSNGLFNGMAEDMFGPEVTVTRGMLVTVLYRLEGSPATNKSIPFADVDMSMYYANAISWAKQNNIVNGIHENNFAPNAEITREQLATILYRYAKAKGMDVSVGENTNILSYDDATEMSEYAIPALQWACGSGIIKGRTESTIVPGGNAKRSEVATMIQRFIEL